jgi:hypothetical protein
MFGRIEQKEMAVEKKGKKKRNKTKKIRLVEDEKS